MAVIMWRSFRGSRSFLWRIVLVCAAVWLFVSLRRILKERRRPNHQYHKHKPRGHTYNTDPLEVLDEYQHESAKHDDTKKKIFHFGGDSDEDDDEDYGGQEIHKWKEEYHPEAHASKHGGRGHGQHKHGGHHKTEHGHHTKHTTQLPRPVRDAIHDKHSHTEEDSIDDAIALRETESYDEALKHEKHVSSDKLAQHVQSSDYDKHHEKSEDFDKLLHAKTGSAYGKLSHHETEQIVHQVKRPIYEKSYHVEGDISEDSFDDFEFDDDKKRTQKPPSEEQDFRKSKYEQDSDEDDFAVHGRESVHKHVWDDDESHDTEIKRQLYHDSSKDDKAIHQRAEFHEVALPDEFRGQDVHEDRRQKDDIEKNHDNRQNHGSFGDVSYHEKKDHHLKPEKEPVPSYREKTGGESEKDMDETRVQTDADIYYAMVHGTSGSKHKPRTPEDRDGLRQGPRGEHPSDHGMREIDDNERELERPREDFSVDKYIEIGEEEEMHAPGLYEPKHGSNEPNSYKPKHQSDNRDQLDKSREVRIDYDMDQRQHVKYEVQRDGRKTTGKYHDETNSRISPQQKEKPYDVKESYDKTAYEEDPQKTLYARDTIRDRHEKPEEFENIRDGNFDVKSGQYHMKQGRGEESRSIEYEDGDDHHQGYPRNTNAYKRENEPEQKSHDWTLPDHDREKRDTNQHDDNSVDSKYSAHAEQKEVSTVAGPTPELYRGQPIDDEEKNFYTDNLPDVQWKPSDHSEHGSGLHVCSQRQRQALLQETCQSMANPDKEEEKYMNRRLKLVAVNHKRKLMYCVLAKTGSRSWLNFMVNLSSEVRHSEGESWRVRDASFMESAGLEYRHKLHIHEVEQNYRDYTKFVVVRHPLQRLSAAYFEAVIKNHHFRKRGGVLPTFTEFATMVARKKIHPQVQMARYINHCQVCRLKYDYILKTETIDSDFHMFASDLGTHISLPRVHVNKVYREREHTDAFKYDNLLQDLQPYHNDVIKNLASVYKADMNIFGYGWDFEQRRSTCSTVQGDRQYACC